VCVCVCKSLGIYQILIKFHEK